MGLSKAARLVEFADRLSLAKPCATADEALKLLSETLDAVEDEFSGWPNQPDQHESDGRMYPPQADAARRVEGRPDLTRYRSFQHDTYVSELGALLIWDRKAKSTFLSKAGTTGSEITL